MRSSSAARVAATMAWRRSLILLVRSTPFGASMHRPRPENYWNTLRCLMPSRRRRSLYKRRWSNAIICIGGMSTDIIFMCVASEGSRAFASQELPPRNGIFIGHCLHHHHHHHHALMPVLRVHFGSRSLIHLRSRCIGVRMVSWKFTHLGYHKSYF